MLKDLHLSYLTGTAQVVDNELFIAKLGQPRPARTWGQMFFQPYESKKEFIFCARHTVQPLAFIGLAIADPFFARALPLAVATIGAGFLIAAAIYNQSADGREAAIWAVDVSDAIMTAAVQAIIDLLVFPLSVLIMATRGLSTGLAAAEVYDYNAPQLG